MNPSDFFLLSGGDGAFLEQTKARATAAFSPNVTSDEDAARGQAFCMDFYSVFPTVKLSSEKVFQ